MINDGLIFWPLLNRDYSQSFAEYLNRRVVFFGIVLNW